MYPLFVVIFFIGLLLYGARRNQRKVTTNRRCIAANCTYAAAGPHARYCKMHISEYVRRNNAHRSGFAGEGK